MKQTEELYSCRFIAKELGISIKSVYNKIARLNIKCIKYDKGHSMYSLEQLNQLKSTVKNKEIEKYYPIKSHEIWHIYQSKINL